MFLILVVQLIHLRILLPRSDDTDVMLERGVCEGYGCGSELEGGGATGETVFEDDCNEGDAVAEDDGLEGEIALLGDGGDALSPYNTPNRLAIPLSLEEEGLTDTAASAG